jgi:hypothetical protein
VVDEELRLQAKGLKLVGAFVTHYHFDHTGGTPPKPFDALGVTVSGIRDLAEGGVRVYVHKDDAAAVQKNNGVCPSCVHRCNHQEVVSVGESTTPPPATPMRRLTATAEEAMGVLSDRCALRANRTRSSRANADAAMAQSEHRYDGNGTGPSCLSKTSASPCLTLRRKRGGAHAQAASASSVCTHQATRLAPCACTWTAVVWATGVGC